MKLKIRADAKDIRIFVCFVIFLLYMCAIAVLNAHYLATEGKIYGIVPFEAFTPKYIGATLTIFLLALLGIFAATGSYFFDREKGFGFSVGKKVKDGYARWAKPEEMKKTLTFINFKCNYYENAIKNRSTKMKEKLYK